MIISRRSLLTSALAASLLPVQRAMAVSGEPFPVYDNDQDKVEFKFRRHVVDFASAEPAGTVVVDPGHKFLFLVLGQGKAMRFGVSVGKYTKWSGETVVGKMTKWPVWTPTPDHLKRRPDLAKYLGGMPGGPENPMGARAIYLFQNNVDTTYRIHGTDVPSYIGTKATAGCFGMFNADVIYLYERVQLGTRVVVMPS